MTQNKDKQTDELSSDPPEKGFNIGCPRLGHQINFSYCQSENSGLPCFKTLDCWFPHFNVHKYLKEKLKEEDFKKVFIAKGKPKVFSLMDLIEQAKQKKEE